MSKIKLKCPHCDYSKDVQRDMIPHEEVRLKCPKCSQSFVFNVREAEEAARLAASGIPEATPAPAPAVSPVSQPEPAVPAAPVDEDEVGKEEKVRAVCPGCGFFRKISASLVPPEGKRMKCPRCKESFTVGGAEEADGAAAVGDLSGHIGEPLAAVPEGVVETVADQPIGRGLYDDTATSGGAFDGPVTGAPLMDGPSGVPPMPDTDYAGHEMGDLSGHIGGRMDGGLEPTPYAEPEYPGMVAGEGSLFEGEPGVPVTDDSFPPQPRYQPEYDEAAVGELSGHMSAIMPEGASDETVADKAAEPYYPARNIPQAEMVEEPAPGPEKAGGGYKVSLPDDLMAAEISDEDIEIVAQPSGEEVPEPSEEPDKTAYAIGATRRPKSYDAHKYAVTNDLDDLLKEPEKKKSFEAEPDEVTTYDVTPKDGGITELSEYSDLFREAWAVLRSRAGTFIPLMLSGPILALISIGLFYGVGALGGVILPEKSFTFRMTGAGIGVVAALYMLSWWLAAFFQAVADETLKTREAFEMTGGMAGSVMWLALMSVFVIAGVSFLFCIPAVALLLSLSVANVYIATAFFIVPALALSAWFSFSFFIMIGEDERGLSAMIKSREYVRGNWFGVFGRLLAVWALSAALLFAVPLSSHALAPGISSFVTTVCAILFLFSLPYTVTFCFLIYLDLKDIKGVMRIRPTASSKGKFVLIGTVGFIAPIVLVSVILSQGAAGSFGSKYGFDAENIVSGLIGTDDAVKAAYMDYREMVKRKDESGVVEALSGTFAPSIKDKNVSVAKYLSEASPDKAMVASVNFRKSRAYLELESVREGGVMVGRAEMIKEHGDWVVDSEEWILTVRPRPIKLLGGEPAPPIEPIDMEYLTPGPLFGRAAPDPFADKKTKSIRELGRFQAHGSEVTMARFLNDGIRLVTISYFDRSVKLWDVRTGKTLDSVSLPNGPLGIDLIPDGKMAVMTDSESNLIFMGIDDKGFRSPEILSVSYGRETRFDISPNGMLAATASWDNELVIWDLVNRTELRRIVTPEPMRDAVFSPSGDLLAASTDTNKFILYKLDEGRGRVYTIPDVPMDSDVMTIDISQDGEYLITGHKDSTITLWQLPTQRQRSNYLVSNAATWDAKFCPDGMCYATAQQDSKVYVWGTVTSDRLAALEGHTGGVNVVEFSPDGRILASGGKDGLVIIWGSEMPREPLPEFGEIPPVKVPSGLLATAAAVSVSTLTYAPGETIIVSFVAPKDAKPDAWIGIVPSSVPHGSEAENDEHDVSALTLEGLSSGDIEMAAPSEPGDYDIRLFTSDEDGTEAAFAPIQVRE